MQGHASPYTLWNTLMHGRLKTIDGEIIGSRLQPGSDGDCVSMILSAGKIPSLYSLPCYIRERRHICKRLAQTISLPLPTHVITSTSYSDCKLREIYAVNGCYLLDHPSKWLPGVEADVVPVKEYLTHLFQRLSSVTSMNYQLQMQTPTASMTHNKKYLCILIRSNTSLYENKISNIKARRCISTNKSKTFSVLAMGNRKSVCEYNQVLCTDGTCISQVYDCYDDILCSSKGCACYTEDQWVYDQRYCRYHCMLQNCSCPPHYFQCGSGGCIQYALICDSNIDCEDASDEMCGRLTRLSFQGKNSEDKIHTEVLFLIGRVHYCLGYRCLSGECIPLRYVNDLIPDCTGGQADDEQLFLRMFYHGEHFGCEDKSQHPCVEGLPVCFPLEKFCLFDSDEDQNILWCRNGAHLGDCTYINCTNSYKCPQSYCIPFHRVCNGRPDCIHGEDEQMCDDYICKGLLRCKGSRICVHPAQICDGESHCPSSDDEGFCDWKPCGLNCTCVRCSIICTNLLIETLPPLQSDYMRHMSVSRSYIPNPNFENICHQKELTLLYLPGDYIRDICSSWYLDCELYNSIFLLDLSFNMIKTLKPSCFMKLTSLKIIDLAHNDLQFIHGDAFFSLSLEYLDLKHTKITEITAQTLRDTLSIRMLDMSDVHLDFLDTYAENALSHIPKLRFNDPRLCCILSHVKMCKEIWQSLDSCPRLLPHRLMGHAIILVGCFSVSMNIVGLITNAKFLKDSLHVKMISYLMLVNIVLGTYLPFIGSVDIYYGQHIVLYHVSWSQSILCSFMEVSSSTALIISFCLNGLLMFMTVKAVTGIKFYILRTRLAVGILLMTGFAITFNLIQSLLKANTYDDIEASGTLCNILAASKVQSFWQRMSQGFICVVMVSLFMYVLFGTIKIVSYIYKTTEEVLKYSEGDIARNDVRKRKFCKRMVELVLAISFITLPYPVLKTLSIFYKDIPQLLYAGVMFSTITLETFYIPLCYLHVPLLNRICKWHGWKRVNYDAIEEIYFVIWTSRHL